jgi:hypothetical protein
MVGASFTEAPNAAVAANAATNRLGYLFDLGSVSLLASIVG